MTKRNDLNENYEVVKNRDEVTYISEFGDK